MGELSLTTTCAHCGRGEAEAPLLAWRYQGQARWICSDCLPLLIHQRERVMAKLEAGSKQPEAGA